MENTDETVPSEEVPEILEPVEEILIGEETPERTNRPPVRLIFLACNIVLSLGAFISTAFGCLDNACKPYNGGKISTRIRIHILWIIISFLETVVTSAVLAAYILLPKWKSKGEFRISMTLYNLIQSLLHFYFWMLGTVHETRILKEVDIAIIAGVLFTQLNGCLYFSAIFLVRDENKVMPLDEMQLENQINYEQEISSSPNVVSGEETADTSKVEVISS